MIEFQVRQRGAPQPSFIRWLTEIPRKTSEMPAQRPDNVYHFFLKIAADGGIPDHYELLGLPRFTEDPAVIKQAAVARSSELRGWDNSDYHVWSNELLDEVVVALMVLESPTDKAEYDRDLRQTLDRAGAPLPEAASPKPNRVVNGIRELRRVLTGIPKPVPPTPPSAAVNVPAGDGNTTIGVAKPNTAPDKTTEVHFDPAEEEDQSSQAAAPTPPPFGSLDPFWRYAPLRNGLLAALVVVPLIGWWWLTPRTGWLVLSGGVDDLELFVDGKRLAPQGGGSALPLAAGRHTLETKLDDEIVETRELTIPSGGPPLVIELKKPTPPIAKAPFTAEQAKKIQFASAKRLRVQTSFENQVGMSFTLIPAGTFRMGSDERGYSDESPRHEVQISKPFYLGTHEVRQSDYEAVMGGFNPSKYRELDNPVTNVTWAEAKRFCEKLSDREQRRYRLPTEAEWEYACRAGTETMWNFGPENELFAEHGWIEKNSNKATHPVGKLKPNAWGLFDMHGNVSEWCEDRYENKYYSVSPPIDPTGPAEGTALSTRICRGGSCLSLATEARSAFRGSNSSTVSSNSTGFRIVLESDSVAKNELADASSTSTSDSMSNETDETETAQSATSAPEPNQALNPPLNAKPALQWSDADVQAGRIKAPDLSKLKPVWDDDFSSTTKSGVSRGNSSIVVAAKDGTVHFDLKNGSWRWFDTLSRVPKLDEFACRVVAKCKSTGKGFQGWRFLLTDGGLKGVEFVLQRDARLVINPYKGSDSRKFPNIAHPAIKPETENNELMVIHRAGRLEIYVNGVAVCSPIEWQSELRQSRVSIGVRGVTGAHAEYDSLTMWSAKDIPSLEERIAKNELPTPIGATPASTPAVVAPTGSDPFQQGTVWTKRTNGAVSSEFTILKRTGNELEVRYKGSANVIVAKATVTATTIQWSHKHVSKVEKGKAFRGEVKLVGDAVHCKLDWEVSPQNKGVVDLTLEPKSAGSGPMAVASGVAAAGGLDRPITVNFNRTPLQDAVAEIGTKGYFEIDLDGDALKGGGYTKNMTQTFAVTNKPAREVLEQIVQQYSRMVVIQLNGNYRLTTREDADAKKQVIVVPTAATKTGVSTSTAPGPKS